jgi:membrane protein required for colicin V production
MNWLDILILLMLLIPMFIGYKRGLIGIVVPLLGIIVGLFIAGRIYDNVADWLHPGLFGSESQANIVAFIVILVLFFIAIMVVSSLLRGFLSLLFLGWVDRIGGLLAGLIFGSIAAGALLAIIGRFFPTGVQNTVSESALASFLLDTFPFVFHLLPYHFREVIQTFF